MVVCSVHMVAQAQTCISYTSEGLSGCMDKNPYVAEPVAPSSTVIAPAPIQKDVARTPDVMQSVQAPQNTMDAKVEEFYKTYDKPPREFVEWTLDPSVENAVRWARKYDEMIERNRKMAEAWTAAQKIYRQTKNSGGDLPELSQPLPPIPEYPGVVPPKNSRPQAVTAKENPYTRTSDAISFERQRVSDGGSLTPIGSFEDDDVAASGPIQVSYYFSNVCPFCKKFEPELRVAMARFSAAEVELTCVDASPKERTESNVAEGIDCNWRALLPGELEAFGVRSTPTLLISTSPKEPLVKREGVLVATEIEMLLNNLVKARTKS